jgi:hypothetical protein
MQILPIDLTAIVAIIMGMSVILIPVAGLTARFALKPLVESLARVWEVKGMEETLAIAERRIALLEQQVEIMEGNVRNLEEGQAFDRKLGAGGAGTAPSGEPPR